MGQYGLFELRRQRALQWRHAARSLFDGLINQGGR